MPGGPRSAAVASWCWATTGGTAHAHGAFLWRFHAVHHSIEEMDWVARGGSTARLRLHAGVHRAAAVRARLRRGACSPAWPCSSAAGDLPARQRASAVPGPPLGGEHARVAPLAPRDRPGGRRQELRPARGRHAFRDGIPAQGSAADRLRHQRPRAPGPTCGTSVPVQASSPRAVAAPGLVTERSEEPRDSVCCIYSSVVGASPRR